MMTKKQISVIVPVYNSEQYLPKCIESILSQTYTDFELILVNDGSKDRSGDICDDYARQDPRVKVFHKENGGVSSARNLGIENAIGCWVTFVDSDDYLTNGYLKAIENAETYDLVVSGFERNIDDGKVIKKIDISGTAVNRSEVVDYFNLNLNHEAFTYMCAKFFKMKHIRHYNIRFDTRLRFSEDTVFNLTYYQYVNSLTCQTTGRYVYRLFKADSMRHKHSVDVDMLITLRDELCKIYFELNVSNPHFESSYLGNFMLIEEYNLYNRDEKKRKKYYYHPYQLKLEKNALHVFPILKRMLYKSCKHLPYFLCKPLIILNLKYRLKRYFPSSTQ